MRKIDTEGSSIISNTAKVQKFLFPNSRVKARNIVIVPVNHTLWTGVVIESEWSSPLTLYDELSNAFNQYLKLDTTISLSMRLVRYYKLYEFYWYDQLEESVVDIKTWDQYKFVVQLVKGFDVVESKIMRTRDTGVLRIEESLLYFKENRLGIKHGAAV
jgi:hypothetical protein